MDDDPRLDAQDIASVNNQTLLAVARMARWAGMAVAGAGVLGIALGTWLIVRQQMQIDETYSPTSFGEFGDVSFIDRVDLLAGYFGTIVSGALALGIGFGLLLMADRVTVQHGGSLTSLREGDLLPDADVDEDEDEPL